VGFVVVGHGVVVVLDGQGEVLENHWYHGGFDEEVLDSDNVVDQEEELVAVGVHFEREDVVV